MDKLKDKKVIIAIVVVVVILLCCVVGYFVGSSVETGPSALDMTYTEATLAGPTVDEVTDAPEDYVGTEVIWVVEARTVDDFFFEGNVAGLPVVVYTTIADSTSWGTLYEVTGTITSSDGFTTTLDATDVTPYTSSEATE